MIEIILLTLLFMFVATFVLFITEAYVETKKARRHRLYRRAESIVKFRLREELNG